MQIRFFVLLATLCICAHVASAHSAKGESKPERRVIETEDEEIEIIHHSHKKDTKPKKTEKKIIKEVVVHKKDPKPKKALLSCAEITKAEKAECETEKVPVGYKGVFEVKEDAHCEWTCNYEALPTTPGPATTKAPPKKKPIKKKKAAKNLKECSGEKKIHFSNCLVKINGLIAWGAKTKNFDKKWDKFLAAAKAPKGGKKAKGAKGGKPAAKPAKGADKPAAKPAADKPAKSHGHNGDKKH